MASLGYRISLVRAMSPLNAPPLTAPLQSIGSLGGTAPRDLRHGPRLEDDTTNDTTFEDHDFRRGRPPLSSGFASADGPSSQAHGGGSGWHGRPPYR